ncbi:NACHT, LRR and PYD domains-containing protein 3-like isoform X2 [Scyliorhinus torazame]|uniref:NACHT, LRR and PYD domains-containing protein 3-like isoform X2 n=1 Tax=Scyliorhinus torazame TaxID=75743 RepID=UPI003B5B6501
MSKNQQEITEYYPEKWDGNEFCNVFDLDIGVIIIWGREHRACECALRTSSGRGHIWNEAQTDLSKVGLKGSCAQDLVFAFSRNQSVTYLNLDTNSFRDQSVPALCNLIQTSKSLKRIVLMWNQFSPDGKNQLKSLQESRPGLSVAV